MMDEKQPDLYVLGVPVVNGCNECIIVGHCPRCHGIVCFGHHANVEVQIAMPGEDLRERWKADPIFEDRCPVIPNPAQEGSR
jgi:hypothetical protein